MHPEVGRAQNSITLSRFKDSVAWHITIGFDDGGDQDEFAVLDRIDAIHRLLKQRYAPDPDDLVQQLEKSQP